MPWTFAHPAAVLWLRERPAGPLSLAGLVAGSIAPDAGYYVQSFDLAALAHTPLGLVTVCPPIGLVLVAIFRAMHRPLAMLLPQPHRRALLSLPRGPSMASPAALASILLSVIIGALTHILWDSFTHKSGTAVECLPLLQQPVFTAIGEEFHVYNLLQHGSTVLGVAIIAVAYRRRLHRLPVRSSVSILRDEAWRYALLAAMGVVSAGVAGGLAVCAPGAALDEAHFLGLVFRVVVDSTSVFAVLLAAVALLAARLTPPALRSAAEGRRERD